MYWAPRSTVQAGSVGLLLVDILPPAKQIIITALAHETQSTLALLQHQRISLNWLSKYNSLFRSLWTRWVMMTLIGLLSYWLFCLKDGLSQCNRYQKQKLHLKWHHNWKDFSKLLLSCITQNEMPSASVYLATPGLGVESSYRESPCPDLAKSVGYKVLSIKGQCN